MFTNAMDDFRVWLASKGTNMAVTDAIIDRLLAWRSGQPAPAIKSRLRGLAEAIAEQDDIGWNSAFEGRWSTKWLAIQDLHFKNNHLRRSGLRWLTAMIGKLWMTAWSLWEHRNGVQQTVLLASRRAANRPVIEDEYGKGPIGLASYDQGLFKTLLSDRLKEALNKQDAWIRRVRAARSRAAASKPVRSKQATTNFRNILSRLGHNLRPDQQNAITEGSELIAPPTIERVGP